VRGQQLEGEERFFARLAAHLRKSNYLILPSKDLRIRISHPFEVLALVEVLDVFGPDGAFGRREGLGADLAHEPDRVGLGERVHLAALFLSAQVVSEAERMREGGAAALAAAHRRHVEVRLRLVLVQIQLVGELHVALAAARRLRRRLFTQRIFSLEIFTC